jgi:ABC-type multidrug transport system fused ATPase/permease subunit
MAANVGAGPAPDAGPRHEADDGVPDSTAKGTARQPLPAPPVSVHLLWPFLAGRGARLAAAGLIAVVGTVLGLAQPALVRDLIESVGRGSSSWRTPLLLLAVAVGEALASAAQSYLLQLTGEEMVLRIRTTLARHLLHLPIREFDRRRIGDLLSRASSDVTVVRSVVTSGFISLLSAGVMFVGVVVLMVRLDPWLFAITFTAIVLGTISQVAAGRAVRNASHTTQDETARLSAAMERSLSAVRTIRAATAEERETRCIEDVADRAFRAGSRMARLVSVIQPVMALCVQSAFIVVLAVGGARVAGGTISLGEFIAFILYLFMLVSPVTQGAVVYTQLQAALASLARIQEVLSVPAEGAGQPARASFRRPASPEEGRERCLPVLRFQDVSFGYTPDKPVLRGLTFDVERGSRTALVGPSGAGKSTVLALIERFYDLDGGRILFDGEDLRDLPHHDVRRRLAYVEQGAPVLAGTVADNLRLREGEITDQRLAEVLRIVQLDDLLTDGRGGLDTPVGDAGHCLSGGQRQRLAWARVLLGDEPVLLLDEPTSSVDARNEAVLRKALDRAGGCRTVLVVAHRLATIVHSDRIVVMDRGRVVDAGRHEELLSRSALYRDLATSQLIR